MPMTTPACTPRRPTIWVRSLAAGTALACGGALGVATAANAGQDAARNVTIKADGTDIFGYVSSPEPRTCADDRMVAVFKVKRKGDKKKVASDNASLHGDRYQSSVGNLGMEGRTFARAKRIAGCKADSSKIMQVESSGG